MRNKRQNKGDDLNIEQLLISKQCIGVGNAISKEYLMQLLGLETHSALMYHIARCRKNKQAILCKYNAGYYYPENKEELQSYLLTLQKKADTLTATIESIENGFIENRLGTG